MTQFVRRFRLALIFAGLSLPAAVAQAADAYAQVGVWPRPADTQIQVLAPDDAAARDDGQTTVRLVGGWDSDASAAHTASKAAPKPGAKTAPKSVSKSAAKPSAKKPAKSVPGASPLAKKLPPTSESQPGDPRLAMRFAMDPNLPPPPQRIVPQPTMADEQIGPFDGDGCACCCQGDCEMACCQPWIVGADFLLVTPHKSANSAFQISPNGGSGSDIQNVAFDAPYNGSFRVFAGRQLNCDDTLQLSYTFIFSDTHQADAVPDGSVILSPLGATLNPGDSITATDHVWFQLWDIDDIRRINLPSCMCGGSSPWDASWSWGVRIVDLEDSVKNEVNGPDAEDLIQRSTFVGAGPRLGLQLRRQFGCSEISGFVAAHAGLLLGDQNTIGTNTPTALRAAQVVPDFDIRVGLAWQPSSDLMIAAGWTFEIFGDAMALNDNASLALLELPQASSLSYDGLFVRSEFHF